MTREELNKKLELIRQQLKAVSEIINAPVAEEEEEEEVADEE